VDNLYLPESGIVSVMEELVYLRQGFIYGEMAQAQLIGRRLGGVVIFVAHDD
jgi:hypothetical protein